VAIFEREILGDDDGIPLAATVQIRADATLWASGTRLQHAPRSNWSLEESVRLESRDRGSEILRPEAAAAGEENAKQKEGAGSDFVETISVHSRSNCRKGSKRYRPAVRID